MNYLRRLFFVMFAFCATSCDMPQKSASNASQTDTLRIVENYVPEILVADPKKSIEYKIKYLNIDNCLSSGHCYLNRYEFNSCGKVAMYRPPMVATSWTYSYDNECRLTSEIASDYSQKDISYFKPDSIWVKYFSKKAEDSDSPETEFKCKLLPPVSEFAYNHDAELSRSDTIGALTFPCGEYFEGNHTKKTYYYEYGLIASIHYFDFNDNLILVQDYLYEDSSHSPIKLIPQAVGH